MGEIRRLQIGNVTLENNLILAPMAGVESEAVRNSLDWDLLEHLATDEDELRASILNDWRYRDFYIRYQEYVERWRPCES